MAQKCSVCIHAQRPEIDQLLVSGRSVRDIAGRFHLSKTAVHSHGKHISEKLVLAKEAGEVVEAKSLLDRVHDLLETAQRLTTAAEHAKDLKTALSGIGQVRGCLQLLGEISGELSRRAGVSVEFNFRFRSEQDAIEKIQHAIDQNGLRLTVLPKWSRDDNERRIAELLQKAGHEPWVPKRCVLTVDDLDFIVAERGANKDEGGLAK